MNPLVLLGIAAIAYYFYSQRSAQGNPPAAAPASTNSPATTPVYTGPFPQTYQAVVTAALQGLGPGAGNSLQTPDVWNWYLMQAEPSITAPAPEDIFPGNAAPHSPVPFTAWWKGVVPLLPAGLNGLGDLTNAAYSIPENPVASHLASRWYV